MNKVDKRVFWQFWKAFMSRFGPFQAVPPDLRNLNAGRFKSLDLTFQESQALNPGRFLALLKQKLVAKADSKKFSSVREPISDWLKEISFSKMMHRVAKGADTGKDEGIKIIREGPKADSPNVSADRLQRF